MPVVSELQAKVSYDDSEVTRGVPRTESTLGKLASGIGSVGAVGATAFLGLGVAAVAGIGSAIGAATDFQQNMAGVQALLGGTAADMALLSATALKLGQDTTLSGVGAKEAAQAMQELAASGFTAGEMADGAARGVLLLASATGTAIPQAAQIAGDSFNVFRQSMGLTAAQMPLIADLFASTANVSSISLQDIGQSMEYIGPVAASMGISIQNVSATIAELGNQGIKGSSAGTALRSMLVSIASPSKQAAGIIKDLGLQFFDAQGHVKDFGGISEELKTRLSGLTDQQRANALATIFGKEALSAATVLYGEGAAGIQKYLDQITKEGAAADAGAIRNNTLHGSVEALRGAFETAQIALGTAFLPALKGVTDWAGNAVAAAIPLIQQYGPVLVGWLTQGIGVLRQWGGAVWGAVSAVVGAFQAFTSGKATLAEFIGGMEIFAGTILGKLGGLAGAVAPYIGQFFSAIGSAIATYGPQIVAQMQIWAGYLVDWIATTAIPWLIPKLEAFATALTGWITGTAVPAVVAALGGLASAFGSWISGTAIPSLATNLPLWGEALWGWIATTAVPAVTGAVGALASALGTWVTEQAIPFLQANLPLWSAALLGYLGTIAGNIGTALVGAAQALGTWIQTQGIPAVQANFPAWQAAVLGFLGSIAGNIGSALSAAGTALGDWIQTKGIPAIQANYPAWQGALLNMLDALASKVNGATALAGTALGEWIIKATPTSVVAMQQLGAKLLLAWAGIPIALALVGFQAGMAIGDGIVRAEPETRAALGRILVFLAGGFIVQAVILGFNAGMAIGNGLIGGIDAIWGAVVGKAQALANAVINIIRGALQIHSPSQVMAEVGRNVVLGLVQGMDQAQQDAAKKAADVASAVAKAITDTLGALAALGKFNLGKLPSGAQVTGFLGGLDSLIAQFAATGARFSEKASAAAAQFGDTAGKVVAPIKAGVEGLLLIGTFKAPLGAAVSAFLASLADFMEKFGVAAGGFESDTLAASTAFADAAAKVGGAVGNALKGLQDLAGADWAKSSPTGSAMGWFTHLTASLVANFALAATLFADDALAAASAFADAAGKVGAATGSALKGLQDLAGADWAKASPTGGTMGWFTHLVASLTQNFAAAAAAFKEGALKNAADFADSAGKVLATIKPAVDGLAAIATLAAPSTQAIDDLLAGIRYIVARFGEMAAALSSEGIANLGAFGTATGTVLAAAKTATDLFKGFDKLVIPSAKAIEDLWQGIKYLVQRFGDMAATLTSEGIANLGAFASAASSVVGTAKGAVDLFKDFDKLVIPAAPAIDALVGAIGYVINQIRAVAASIGAGIKDAQTFASGVASVFQSLKAGLDLLVSLKAYKDKPTEVLSTLLDGLRAGLGKLGEIQGAANAYKQQSDTVLGTMREAAANLARAQSIASGLPSDFGTLGTAAGDALATGVRDSLGIHSPSTVLAEVGRQAVAGLALGMDQAQQDAASKAASVASAVAKAITDSLSAFSALSSFRGVPTDALYALGKSLRAAVTDFAIIAGQVTQEATDAAAKFAEGTGKVVATIGGGVAAFKQLATYTEPPRAALYAFGKTVRLLVADFALIAEQVGVDAAEQAGKFADGAGKAVGILGSGVAGFLGLKDYIAPSQSALAAFVRSTQDLVGMIAAAGATMGAAVLDDAQSFAAAATAAFGALKSALDAGKALADSPGGFGDAVAALKGFSGDLGGVNLSLGALGAHGGGGTTINVTVVVTGNTVLGDDAATGQRLAAILAPELRRQIGLAGAT